VLAAASELPKRPALLRQSVECLTAAQNRFELARALSDSSVVYQQLGELDRARLLARRAAQVTKACLSAAPAAAEESRAPEQRTAAQAGWRQDGHQTRQVLSEAERRVAELAALGHTNRQISQMLYITVSTVEQHLTRVYRKLGITQRTDLLAEYELRGQTHEYQPDNLADADYGLELAQSGGHPR
jgi:DNA-binding NarL/FixJ family response regulator